MMEKNRMKTNTVVYFFRK